MGEDKWNGAREPRDPVGKQNQSERGSILNKSDEEHPDTHVS